MKEKTINYEIKQEEMKKELRRKGKSSIVKKCNHWNENPNLTIEIE